jgi:hypothetical protein
LQTGSDPSGVHDIRFFLKEKKNTSNACGIENYKEIATAGLFII